MSIFRIAEIVASNFQVRDIQAALEEHLPLAELQNLGIDPSEFIGLSPEEIGQKLADAGLGADALNGLDLQEIIAKISQMRSG